MGPQTKMRNEQNDSFKRFRIVNYWKREAGVGESDDKEVRKSTSRPAKRKRRKTTPPRRAFKINKLTGEEEEEKDDAPAAPFKRNYG